MKQFIFGTVEFGTTDDEAMERNAILAEMYADEDAAEAMEFQAYMNNFSIPLDLTALGKAEVDQADYRQAQAASLGNQISAW